MVGRSKGLAYGCALAAIAFSVGSVGGTGRLLNRVFGDWGGTPAGETNDGAVLDVDRLASSESVANSGVGQHAQGGRTSYQMSATTQAASTSFGFDPPEAYPSAPQMFVTAIEVGDVNGDSRDDIVVANAPPQGVNFSPSLSIYIQGADGVLASPMVFNNVDYTNIALGDVTGDGVNDIVVTSDAGVFFYSLQRNGGYAYGYGYGINKPAAVSIFDVDRDGFEDAVTVSSGTGHGGVYYANGTGGFRDVVAETPHSPVGGLQTAGDVTGDGLTDVVVASGNDLFQVIPRDRLLKELEFPIEYPTFGVPVGVGIGDFNRDGLMDVALAARGDGIPSQIHLTLQDPKQHVLAESIYIPIADWPAGLAVGDIDGDGRDDLVTAHGWDTLSVGYVLQSATGFGAEQLIPDVGAGSGLPSETHVIAIGDVNSDGCSDIVVGVDSWVGGNSFIVLKGRNCTLKPRKIISRTQRPVQ